MRTISIDLEAIASNYRTLKSKVPGQVMAIVKADAFGHGMIEVARKLDSISVDYLGVADIEEALLLRKSGIKAKIMAWLHGSDADFESALEHDIELGVATTDVLNRIVAAAKKTKRQARLHLKIDTGLGRNGASFEDWPELIRAVGQLDQNSLVLVGVFSHLSGTSKQDDLNQLEVFKRAVAIAKDLGVEFQLRHLAASPATLSLPQTHLDMVRCGIALYGLDPSDGTKALDHGLRPAMRVSSEVVQLKRVPEGHGVSYGYLHKTSKETTLALVPFGYAEGLPRVSTGKAEVLLNGNRYKILGRVAMDQFVLDIGDDSASIGDEVVIFGDASKGEPTAEELAKASQTINYEIVTRIGGRARRVFL